MKAKKELNIILKRPLNNQNINIFPYANNFNNKRILLIYRIEISIVNKEFKFYKFINLK